MNNLIPTLPPKTTSLQRSLTAACAPLGDIPVPVRDVWNPDTCPVEFLPHLAWAFSVDRWDDTWPVETKRSAIKSAYYIHRKKGTVAAVRRVVEMLGYLIKIVEWWQTEPKGPRGTFYLEVGVLDTGITDEMFFEMERLIDDAKPKSRHMTGLSIHLESRVKQAVVVAGYTGDEVTVYPYTPEEISTTFLCSIDIGNYAIDTMTVFPSLN